MVFSTVRNVDRGLWEGFWLHTDHLQRPARTSACRWCIHRVMRRKPILLPGSQIHFGSALDWWDKKIYYLVITKSALHGERITSIPSKTPATYCQFGGGSIMLWANSGTGALVKFECRMNSTQYQQILQDNVQASVTKLKLCRGWIFQQDNA